MAAYVELDGKHVGLCSICTRTVNYNCPLVNVFVYETFTDEVIKYFVM